MALKTDARHANFVILPRGPPLADGRKQEPGQAIRDRVDAREGQHRQHRAQLRFGNLARTHGQPASPTTVGKEIYVFVDRLTAQIDLLKTIPFSAKFGGATGNFNAHQVAYPAIDWVAFADHLVNKILGLSRSRVTTQIDHYDNLAAFCDNFKRINTILVDLNRDERVQVHAADAYVMPDFGVARTAWEADVIVDLPVVKTHVRTGITCGLKNMKGVLPGEEKKRTHRMGLDRGIVDLNRVMRPHYTVVDAIVGVQGTHTRPEDRVPLGCLLAGADVVAVDKIAEGDMG